MPAKRRSATTRMPRAPSRATPAAPRRTHALAAEFEVTHLETSGADATRERLCAAAEALFLEHGYEGSTLRMVATQAGVNLAAANYHFGGKDALFQKVIAARLDALHEARLALLDQYEQAEDDEQTSRATGPVALTCERLLAALFIPALQLARDPRVGGPDFLRLLGRAYVDLSPALRGFLSERYAEAIHRYKEAFGRALPHLSKQELSWRLHFMLGALSFTLAGTDAWRLIATITPGAAPDAQLLRRLSPFLIAGLQAPVPELEDDPRDALRDEVVVPIDATANRRAA